MIKRLKHLILGLAVTASMVLPALTLAPQAVSAQASNTTTGGATQTVCEGLGGSGCNGSGATDINKILKLALNILSAVVGFISVIMIIVGGLKYVMSQGDSNNVNSAKNTILYAVIGLVIVALAQVIVKFVLTKVKNA